MPESPLPPIECEVSVASAPAEAFRRFVHDFAEWWPRGTHSIGGKRVRAIVFEAHAGGCIYEEHVDGRRFQWGRVLEVEEPARIRFSFHPARDACTAQTVEIRFTAATGGGTRVALTAWDWQNWGRGAARARKGYRMGWNHLLRVWAGQRDLRTFAVDGLSAVARGVQWLRGGTAAAIRRAGGEMDPAPRG